MARCTGHGSAPTTTRKAFRRYRLEVVIKNAESGFPTRVILHTAPLGTGSGLVAEALELGCKRRAILDLS